jgi:hypothetical protein
LVQADGRAGSLRKKVWQFCQRAESDNLLFTRRRKGPRDYRVRSALLKITAARAASAASPLEPVLAVASRLGIGDQLNAAALRMELEAMRR